MEKTIVIDKLKTKLGRIGLVHHFYASQLFPHNYIEKLNLVRPKRLDKYLEYLIKNGDSLNTVAEAYLELFQQKGEVFDAAKSKSFSNYLKWSSI